MEDKELFELCKQVYEKTGWEHKKTIGVYELWHKLPLGDWFIDVALSPADSFDGEVMNAVYTSDYLLNKLPRYLRLQRDDMDYPQSFAFKLRASTKKTTNWRAGYYNTPKKRVVQNLSIDIHADTPLKALLKLTITLHKAGELK